MGGRPNSRPVSTILDLTPDRMVRRVDTFHFEQCFLDISACDSTCESCSNQQYLHVSYSTEFLECLLDIIAPLIHHMPSSNEEFDEVGDTGDSELHVSCS
ncbi:hypothetical protein K449DRAFT_45786 [Hypoxylon sp. EC38]|nr:hypothetical protein K449DRAFT_45786 [Hypoxylon sp. EC38]